MRLFSVCFGDRGRGRDRKGEPGEGSEAQVKSIAAKSRQMIGAASISDLVEFLWQGAAALKRPRPLSRSPTEPDDSESWAA